MAGERENAAAQQATQAADQARRSQDMVRQHEAQVHAAQAQYDQAKQLAAQHQKTADEARQRADAAKQVAGNDAAHQKALEQHRVADEKARQALAAQEQAKKKFEQARQKHAEVTTVAQQHHVQSNLAQQNLDSATQVRKAADQKTQAAVKDAVSAAREHARNNPGHASQVTPLNSAKTNPPQSGETDAAKLAMAHQKALQASARKTVNGAHSQNPKRNDYVATNPLAHVVGKTQNGQINGAGTLSTNNLDQHKQALTTLAKGPIKTPSKTTFQDLQNATIAKQSPAKQAALKATVDQNNTAVKSAKHPVIHGGDMPTRKPGTIQHLPIITHNNKKPPKTNVVSPGPQPNPANKGKLGPIAITNASLNAITPPGGLKNVGPVNVNAGALFAGMAIGAIGEAILLGPGAFNPGGIPYGPLSSGGGVSDDVFDPAAPFNNGSVFVPDENTEGEANPSGFLVSVNQNPGQDWSEDSQYADQQGNSIPDQIDLGPANAGGDSENPYAGQTASLDAVHQSGRYLTITNLTSSKVTMNVKYHAVDQAGAWKWFPSAPEVNDDALSFELESGQGVELWDGDWHVYADKARIWATDSSGQRQWLRYKSQDVLLVSETDDQGQPSYLSAEIQTLNFGLK